MTPKIVDGDYLKHDGKTSLITVEYIEELLQNIKLILTARRGEFYPNKNFGSYINSITLSPKEEYAVAFARQALDDIDGVFVKNVRFDNKTAIFDLMINDKERQVSIAFENNV